MFVCGCAIDYCVGGLALDAKKAGFETYIVSDAAASIFPDGSAVKAWSGTHAAGIRKISSADIE